MARPFRNVLRAIGLDYRKGPREHWQRVAALLYHFKIDRVLDVGANTGQYVGYLRDAGWRGDIVSFEPVTAVHEALARNAARDANWQAAPAMALGATDGETEITVSYESDMSSLLPLRPEILKVSPTSAPERRERVTMRRLDSVFDEYVPNGARVFVKIDTQGSENVVLDGAAKSLERIIGLQIEVSLVPLYTGEASWRDIVDRIEAAGFELRFLLPGYFDRHLMRMLQFDGVFFRRDAETMR